MSGEHDDFEAYFAALYPRARSVALRIVASVPDAEDVAAEALARALVRWRRVGELSYRDAWVLRVATNLALDLVRRGRPPATRSDTAVRGPEEDVVLRLALVEALNRLPLRQRQAVVLRHLAGLPEAEVAASLGVSPNTAKKHLQRGLAALRARLGPQTEEMDIGLA